MVLFIYLMFPKQFNWRSITDLHYVESEHRTDEDGLYSLIYIVSYKEDLLRLLLLIFVFRPVVYIKYAEFNRCYDELKDSPSFLYR